MEIASTAALITALCWALAGLTAVYPVQVLGPLTFNRIRMQFIAMMLLLIVLATGGWRTLNASYIIALLLSGTIGILIGDSFLYTSLQRLGPRRNSILFSTNAPCTALLGFIFLDERLNIVAIMGITLVVIGVICAIAFGQRHAQKSSWEDIRGSLLFGVAIALCAAVCQSVSALIARPVMSAGVDPVAANLVRVSVALVALTCAGFVPRWRNTVPLTPRMVGQTAISGMFGMGIGMTCLMFALAHGKTGLVATLSSVTPVMILPILWLLTKQRPPLGAWIGAAITVVGIAFILNH